jgi:hypothetical protein
VEGFAGVFDGSKAALFPGEPTPVIDELVACNSHEPSDVYLRGIWRLGRRDGHHERLGRQVLGHVDAPAAR